MRESKLDKYKIYHYIVNKELPQIVIDAFQDEIDANQNCDQFRNFVLSELEDFFSIVVEVCNTPDKSTFKTKGYFEQYRTRSIEILEVSYELLDNFRVDKIILKLLTTNEQYHQLIAQRRECALAIHKIFFELLFSDHYNTLIGAKTVEEIDKLVLEAKHAKSRVLLKYDPDYIPTEEIKLFVAKQIEALLEHAKNMKDYLGSITDTNDNSISGSEKSNASIVLNPVIDKRRLMDLNEKFAGDLWEPGISETDFWAYWAIGGMPKPFKAKILPRKENGFVFLLNEMGLLDGKYKAGFTVDEISQLFGIANLEKKKSDVINRHKRTRYYKDIVEKL